MPIYFGSVALFATPGIVPTESVSWDATVNEQHDSVNDITDHPVEEGANVADHVREKPDALTLECLVSDTPLAGTLGTVGPSEYRQGYAKSVWQRVRQLKAGRTFSVITTLNTYDSMAIESVSCPVSIASGEALRFTIRFKFVRIVRTKVFTVPVTNHAGAKGKVDTGKQVTAALGAATRSLGVTSVRSNWTRQKRNAVAKALSDANRSSRGGR